MAAHCRVLAERASDAAAAKALPFLATETEAVITILEKDHGKGSH
jgi:hypothetical protein